LGGILRIPVGDYLSVWSILGLGMNGERGEEHKDPTFGFNIDITVGVSINVF
jgi:hypothetical protein